MPAVDATIRLYCDEPSHDSEPYEAWFAREALASSRSRWATVLQPRRHGRDWGVRVLDVKKQLLHGDTFLTKEPRSVDDRNVFAAPVRVRWRFVCPACGLDVEVRAEKLYRILDGLAAAERPEITLRGLDYMLKLPS